MVSCISKCLNARGEVLTSMCIGSSISVGSRGKPAYKTKAQSGNWNEPNSKNRGGRRFRPPGFATWFQGDDIVNARRQE